MDIEFHHRLKLMTKIEQFYSLRYKKKNEHCEGRREIRLHSCAKHNYGARSCKKINYYTCDVVL